MGPSTRPLGLTVLRGHGAVPWSLVVLTLVLVSCSSLGALSSPSGATPMATATESPGAGPSASIGASAEASPSPEPSASLEPSPEPSASLEPSPEPSASLEPSPEPSASLEPSPSISFLPSASPAQPTPTPQTSPTLETTPGAGGPDLSKVGWFQLESTEVSEETRTLFVGRLDGRVFEVMTVPVPVGASGPVDGKVLIFWHEEGGTVVSLVDTADGSSIELARTEEHFVTAALHPSGEHWYWVPLRADGRLGGLWRRPIAGGPAEPIIEDDWAGGADIDFAVDGSRVAVSSYADPGYDYRVVDLASGEVSEILGTGHRSALGFLGDELVVYVESEPHAEVHFPLIAIDPSDGSQRVVVDGSGMYAAVLPDAEDRPILVRDDYAGDEYALYGTDEDGQERLLFVGGRPSHDPTAPMLRPGGENSVESPGWMAVLPYQEAYIVPGRFDEPIDSPRLLVSLEDGSIIELPELSVEPAG